MRQKNLDADALERAGEKARAFVRSLKEPAARRYARACIRARQDMPHTAQMIQDEVDRIFYMLAVKR